MLSTWALIYPIPNTLELSYTTMHVSSQPTHKVSFFFLDERAESFPIYLNLNEYYAHCLWKRFLGMGAVPAPTSRT